VRVTFVSLCVMFVAPAGTVRRPSPSPLTRASAAWQSWRRPRTNCPGACYFCVISVLFLVCLCLDKIGLLTFCLCSPCPPCYFCPACIWICQSCCLSNCASATNTRSLLLIPTQVWHRAGVHAARRPHRVAPGLAFHFVLLCTQPHLPILHLTLLHL
jgi:hypothetical protein